MVDVRLLYPSEKLEAAARLAEAIGAAGYAVEREALPDTQTFPKLACEAAKAKVLLLIWSRGLVAAAMAGGGLAEARRHSNLIEVSADGIEPSFGGEISPVVLLCGWRGQPFHLGWQRILGEIERLCGSRAVATKPWRDVPSATRRRPAGQARTSPGRPVVRAAMAAGLLIAVTLGGAAALDLGAPEAAPPGQARAVMEGPGHPPAAAAIRPAAALPAQVSIPAVTPAEPVAAPNPSIDRPALRKRAAGPRTAPTRVAAVAEREVKRYSRKHSKTMRLFCQRSGRSTPQCRTFARSMRDARG